MIQSVTELNFREEVLISSTPVLVNFGAPWCGLCKVIEPMLIQFSDRWDDRIRLVNVNADENFKLASCYKLTTLPTLLLCVDGQIVHRLEGFRGREDLQANLERIVTIVTVQRQIAQKSTNLRIHSRSIASE